MGKVTRFLSQALPEFVHLRRLPKMGGFPNVLNPVLRELFKLG